jgi:hypothetical protein
MISVDTAAAIASSDAQAVSPPERSGPVSRGDHWNGTYHCAQGLTQLTVIIDEITTKPQSDRSQIKGTLEFHFEGDGDWEEVEGSYHIAGDFDAKTRQLHLWGDEWIEQPSGYVMVGFRGQVKNGVAWAGMVEGPGCTTFETKLETGR